MKADIVDEYEFRDRSNGLIIWGVLIALGGFGLILSSLSRTGATLMTMPPGAASAGMVMNELKVEALRQHLLAELVGHILYGIPIIVLGLGSILRRSWARRSLQALTLAGVVCGLTFCASVLFFAAFASGNSPDHPARTGTLLFALRWLLLFLFTVLCPLFLHRFYRDPHTVVSCRYHDPGTSPPVIWPDAIVMLQWVLLFCGLRYVASGMFTETSLLFGQQLEGAASRLFWTIGGLVLLGLASKVRRHPVAVWRAFSLLLVLQVIDILMGMPGEALRELYLAHGWGNAELHQLASRSSLPFPLYLALKEGFWLIPLSIYLLAVRPSILKTAAASES